MRLAATTLCAGSAREARAEAGKKWPLRGDRLAGRGGQLEPAGPDRGERPQPPGDLTQIPPFADSRRALADTKAPHAGRLLSARDRFF